MFAGLGAWMAFKRRDDMSIFALIIGLTGVYVSATFARLLVYASIGIIVLAGLGLYEVTRSILKQRQESSGSTIISATNQRKRTKKKKKLSTEGAIQRKAILLNCICRLNYLHANIPMVFTTKLQLAYLGRHSAINC